MLATPFKMWSQCENRETSGRFEYTHTGSCMDWTNPAPSTVCFCCGSYVGMKQMLSTSHFQIASRAASSLFIPMPNLVLDIPWRSGGWNGNLDGWQRTCVWQRTCDKTTRTFYRLFPKRWWWKPQKGNCMQPPLHPPVVVQMNFFRVIRSLTFLSEGTPKNTNLKISCEAVGAYLPDKNLFCQDPPANVDTVWEVEAP